jgi:two-component sensor histidine kinase
VDWAPFDGSGWLEAIHPNDRAGLLEAWQRTLDQDVTYEVEFRAAAPHPDGGERWLFSRGRVERDPRTGRPLRGAGVLLDITERKRVERHRELLLHELNHRVKNTLATVQSIAAQNLRTGCEPAVRQAFQGRLFALASAHDLLTAGNWEGATLGDVALHALRPHMADGQAGRIRVAGPEIRLNPRAALAFSMVVHDWRRMPASTARSAPPPAAVDLTWHVSGDGLRFAWRETGGPPVQAPQRRGFGSRMIEGGLAHEVGGTIVLDFARDGVVCEMAVPPARATVCAQG